METPPSHLQLRICLPRQRRSRWARLGQPEYVESFARPPQRHGQHPVPHAVGCLSRVERRRLLLTLAPRKCTQIRRVSPPVPSGADGSGAARRFFPFARRTGLREAEPSWLETLRLLMFRRLPSVPVRHRWHFSKHPRVRRQRAAVMRAVLHDAPHDVAHRLTAHHWPRWQRPRKVLRFA